MAGASTSMSAPGPGRSCTWQKNSPECWVESREPATEEPRVQGREPAEVLQTERVESHDFGSRLSSLNSRLFDSLSEHCGARSQGDGRRQPLSAAQEVDLHLIADS